MVSFTVGIGLPIDILPPKISLIEETRLPGKYKFVNPLLECDANAVSRDLTLRDLRQHIMTDIKFEEGTDKNNFTSVYYRDMNNGPWFGIRETELFSPASLIKVPLMIAYLKKAESDPSLLEKQITNLTAFDPKLQNFQPQVTLAVNQAYTVKQLIEQMIIYSDDQSYELLNEAMPFTDLARVYSDLGVDISKAMTNPNGNILSVRAYASFFRILFNASYLNSDSSEYALKILSRSAFNSGLVAGLPKNIVTAHKFGERQYLDTGLKQLHDCGIVYLPHKPYLLCIMARGNDFLTLESKIKNISQSVYNYVSQDNAR